MEGNLMKSHNDNRKYIQVSQKSGCISSDYNLNNNEGVVHFTEYNGYTQLSGVVKKQQIKAYYY
jgi:hypothetical protein